MSESTIAAADSLAVGVTGVAGKMGRAVLQELLSDRAINLHLRAAIHRSGSSCIGLDAGRLVGLQDANVLVCDDWSTAHVNVLVDFSLPKPSIDYLGECVRRSIPIVIGTTGFDAAQRAVIAEASKRIPVLVAPNMSVGVNLCFYLLDKITQVVGADADIEVTETHHRHKLDAPSGTAVRMGEVIAGALKQELADLAVYSREGNSTARKGAQIGFTSLRAGDVVGDHTVLFAMPGERLELTHKASSRQTFAIGALRAARWLAEQAPGYYDMQDVLGLRS